MNKDKICKTPTIEETVMTLHKTVEHMMQITDYTYHILYMLTDNRYSKFPESRKIEPFTRKEGTIAILARLTQRLRSEIGTAFINLERITEWINNLRESEILKGE